VVRDTNSLPRPSESKAEAALAGAAKPIGAGAFASMMAALGPFEARPLLAVAVSGGGDSMALALLAAAWARRRRGRAVALTVDHGLRPESRAEAGRVAGWLGVRGIEHHVLAWRGPRPRTGLQEAARDARRELLFRWCRDAGALHLLLAHHLDDQAETFLFRLARGSGPDGLAAMSAIVETPAVRVLRPLLGVTKADLQATLRAAGQEWIEDPSNRDPAFARTRLRRTLAALADAGLTAPALAAAAGRLGQSRAALERATWALLARAAAVHPAGYATVARDVLAEAPKQIAIRALDRLVACVGGRRYPEPAAKIERLHVRLAAASGALSLTLGGCRLAAAGRDVLICREARGEPEPVPAVPGTRRLWDGRFVIDVAKSGATAGRRARGASGGAPAAGAVLARLGRQGWAEIVRRDPALRSTPVPAPARASLPALGDDRGIVGVPHLGYRRKGGRPAAAIGRIVFQPLAALSGGGFRPALPR
jgi:tRNA(Ile)-lysidine synthase